MIATEFPQAGNSVGCGVFGCLLPFQRNTTLVFAHVGIMLGAVTLLWPLYVGAFRSEDLTGWASGTVRALLTEPGIHIPAVVGLAVVVWFVWVLVRRRTLSAFVRQGEVR